MHAFARLQKGYRGVFSLGIEEIASKPKENYGDLGVTQAIHAKDLGAFQKWWGGCTNVEKKRRLALFNYYKGNPYDILYTIYPYTHTRTITV
jgi:hypothetical protein